MTDQEKQAALAWAEGLTMSQKSDHAELMAQKLAGYLRQAESDLAAFLSHDRCNAGMRSRIKTLEEENAALRVALASQKNLMEKSK